MIFKIFNQLHNINFIIIELFYIMMFLCNHNKIILKNTFQRTCSLLEIFSMAVFRVVLFRKKKETYINCVSSNLEFSSVFWLMKIWSLSWKDLSRMTFICLGIDREKGSLRNNGVSCPRVVL